MNIDDPRRVSTKNSNPKPNTTRPRSCIYALITQKAVVVVFLQPTFELPLIANIVQMVNVNGKSVVLRIPTELQPEPNEASPLNQRGRDNHSDASSSPSTGASEQSTKQLLHADMDRSKRVLLRIALDFLLLCCGEYETRF